MLGIIRATVVQAALNVIISVLGTIGVWAFSRYWWQRGSTNVLHGKCEVPLSALLSLASPGEGWDAIRVLRKKIFAKENWRLLFQLCVVLTVTLACMFAGPIAKVSLRSTLTIQKDKIQVLQSTKGDGYLGLRLDSNVEWNDTMQSLDQAGFPYDQLLDYVPFATIPWTYIIHEWDPTWRAECTYREETMLHNVTATGNATIENPLDAFPAYRDSYDPSWLDRSKYRIEAAFSSEVVSAGQQELIFKDTLYWVLVQSDPRVDDHMYTNNETLQLSLSAFYAHSFTVLTTEDATQAAVSTYRPIGSVEKSSFVRTECNITRKPEVSDPEAVPWIWTNDTWSITHAYRTYWMVAVGEKSSKNLTVTPPTPQELFRFYQAYMASVNTYYSYPSIRKVSVWMDTVQLSTIILIMVVLLVLLELWLAGRYFWFLRRHKTGLETMCIPDGKMEWMIRAAKLEAEELDDIDGKSPKDRDYLHKASFGNIVEAGLPPLELARVYTSKNSISGSTSSTHGRSLSKKTLQNPPKIHVRPTKDHEKGIEKDLSNLEQSPNSASSQNGVSFTVLLDDKNSSSRDQSSHENILIPLEEQSTPKRLVPETQNVDPADTITAVDNELDERKPI
ncbi:hypothetical protein CC78DRAFT_541126 [Lojkania enalia]|uniref:Uncharacterized protein n=1 Tax=Lojkania enalia TaxID=147567 RepID=A0A9P4KFZ8_9PLEO|nr:hypothetical protein CC78DRAFT_541126 [Didymosphaeria enalia]